MLVREVVKYFFAAFIFILAMAHEGIAQNYADPNNVLGSPQNPNNLPQSQTMPADTSNIEEDTVKAPKEKFTWKNNPLVASLASTIVPGAGQIYNKKLWKVPIIWGVMGTMGYLIIDNNRRYDDFRRAFILLQKRNPDDYNQVYDQATARQLFNQIYHKRQNEMLPYDSDTARNTQIVQLRRDDARRTRDWITVFFLLAYVLNIMDASVDAHFANFDVSDNLSMKISPSFFTGTGQPQIGINMMLSFNDPRKKQNLRTVKY